MKSAVVSEARAPYGKPPGFKTRMSEDEFVDWYSKQDDTVHAEWVDGEIELKMSENTIHNGIVVWLIRLLGGFVETNDMGRIYTERVQIRVAGIPSRREPDLFFLAKDRLDIDKITYIEGPPDMALEIVSPDSIDRDTIVKFKEYAAGGIREMWLVDPSKKSLEFFYLAKPGEYKKIAMKNGNVSSKVIPGFYVRPEWVWNWRDFKPMDLLKEMGAI